MEKFTSANATANEKTIRIVNGSPFFAARYDNALHGHILKALDSMEKGIRFNEETTEEGSIFRIRKILPLEDGLADSHARASSLFQSIFKSPLEMAIFNINGFLMLTKAKDERLLRESLNALYWANDRQLVTSLGNEKGKPAVSHRTADSLADMLGSN